jgi:hypothetical protein
MSRQSKAKGGDDLLPFLFWESSIDWWEFSAAGVAMAANRLIGVSEADQRRE